MTPRRARFRAVLVGLESGNVSDLSFITFTDEEAAQKWVQQMNEAARRHSKYPPLTRYDYEPIP